MAIRLPSQCRYSPTIAPCPVSLGTPTTIKGTSMRVFLSHSSRDKAAVEALARYLRQQGIDAWLDIWEIGPGDDIIAKMNQGLEQADAGLIVFSAQSLLSPWVSAEVATLTYERIKNGQLLIPVQVGNDAPIPPLLKPLCRLSIEDHQSIAAALLHRRAGPPPLGQPAAGRLERVRLQLGRRGDGAIAVQAMVGDQGPFEATHPAIPAPLLEGRRAFLRGFGGGSRDWAATGRAAMEGELRALGQALAGFCLPPGAAAALGRLVDGAGVGVTVLVEIEAEDPELLGLPYEVLPLADGRLLALRPAVLLRRRLPAPAAAPLPPLPGPLKVLVAVGAPDQGTSSPLLDHERELQNILDAVEPAQRHDNVAVKILEVGHPEQIAAAIAADAYHVLHLSCHGTPGALELEDELGQAVPVTAELLVAPLRPLGRPLPLVVLNSCHGGVEAGTTASLAQALIQAGIPSVVAMQTTVSDRYAADLARAFYGHLSRGEPVLASRALAAARQELEAERLQRLEQGAPLADTLPEAATAALYGAGEEGPLADLGADKQPLRTPPSPPLLGPVPQLAIGDLVGRRRELRLCLRRLRDGAPGGVLLSGIGGVGKSSVAGRVMQRLADDGWLIASHSGRFDLLAIGRELGLTLALAGRPALRPLAEALRQDGLDEELRLRLLQQVLTQEPLLLVLDDFERNLSVGGESFLDRDTAANLELLLAAARRGRLLLTCRHPLPRAMASLKLVPLGPLSGAETRKLVQRLPGLRQQPAEELVAVLRRIGGHPRLLEFLDALLRQGEARLPAVRQRLEQALADCGLALPDATSGLEERLQQVLTLGLRDVLLDELVAIARRRGDEEVLLQLAVSNLPVAPAELARMLVQAGDADLGEAMAAPAAEARVSELQEALQRLAALSLVVLSEEGQAWVHRWSAEGLARQSSPHDRSARCRRAASFRLWRLQQSRSLEDGIEALRNLLQGGHRDDAAGLAAALLNHLQQQGQTRAVAALAAEVLETLPLDHRGAPPLADAEARAHLSLGLTERAVARQRQLLERFQQRAAAEPDRADYQRDLSVSFIKMGDLYRALGQGEAARQAYQASLEIAERLAAAEPDRADYQRDLSVSFNRMGDLYGALGQGEAARQAYQASLEIKERLAAAEPDRADFQLDLVSSLVRVGGSALPIEPLLLQRALAILETLQQQGRLAPVDHDKVETLRQMLQGSGES
jgi:tetratricopeptide (TPR) repeat protein